MNFLDNASIKNDRAIERESEKARERESGSVNTRFIAFTHWEKILMQDIKEMPYQVVVEKVKHWPAIHRLALVQEILRTLSRDAGIPSPRKKTLEQALGLLAMTERENDKTSER
jgi:hypothetical protein